MARRCDLCGAEPCAFQLCFACGKDLTSRGPTMRPYGARAGFVALAAVLLFTWFLLA